MKKASIKKNFLYQMVYEILILILPFVTSPYIARVIGVGGLGTYSYSYSVAFYFVLFSMLGLKNHGNREIAQKRDDVNSLNQTFSDLFAVHAIVSVFVLIVYVIYVLMLKEDQIYAVIQIAFVLSGFFDISWLYFGIEKFKLTVTISSITKILNVICIFAFIRTKDDLWIYCLIMALGMLFSQLALWVPLRKYVHFVKPDFAGMRNHIKPILILFIPAVAVSVYRYMDKIMLGLLSDNIQLGYYENAEKVVNIPITVITAFGTVMLPKMSNLAIKDNAREVRRYISLSMQFVMCLALALTFGLLSVAPVFAPVFWGEEFTFSGTLIMGLSFTIPFISFANVIRTQYLIPNKKDKEYLFSVIAGAVINLIINLILIPIYGSIGAMIGTIAAEITVCLIQTLVVKKKLPIISYLKSFAWFIVVGVLMFVIVYMFGYINNVSVLTLILQVLIGVLFYSICSLIYFLMSKNEIVINLIDKLKGMIKK